MLEGGDEMGGQRGRWGTGEESRGTAGRQERPPGSCAVTRTQEQEVRGDLDEVVSTGGDEM